MRRMSAKSYWFIYRNYFPSKWCFYDGTDEKNLYDAKSAREWYTQIGKFMKEIEIIRPPKQKVKIKLPIGVADGEWNKPKEDKWFEKWLVNTKIEPRMWYVIDQILEDYYYGEDWCFHLRDKNEGRVDADAGVVFTMREVIEWMFRISPIQVRTSTEKETQKVNFIDWGIWQDVEWVDFTYNGKWYKTNFYGLYWAAFRQAIYPNSDFNGSRLQSWQRDYALRRWKITVVIASRGSGKSLTNTEFVAEYLFKELNLPHEFNRPFLIIYWWLSKEANFQVVEYLRSMARALTTNKNILKWNKSEQTLTLYDGFNERVIKFVSQWQEGQGFTGLRPHLVILDESYRLERRMFDVAIGTVEAPIVLISTVDYNTKKNWCHDLFREATARQRTYKPVEELIKETWIKFWMHNVKSRAQLQRKIDSWEIGEMRDWYYSQRPMVWLKYTIYDVDRYSESQKEELIDRAMQAGEDVCLAEYFSEIADTKTIFNSDGLIESNIPDKFDRVSCAFDEAEEFDNPAFVAIGYSGNIAYVIRSEILDKADYIKKYQRIKDLLSEMQSKAPVVTFAVDLTRIQRVWLREVTDHVREPEFPILYTSAKHWEVKRKRPFYLIPKERLISISQDEFFKKNNIIFSSDLDIENWLIEELGNFKRGNKRVEWAKHKSDDQVHAMMMALFWLYWWYIKDVTPVAMAWINTVEERYDAFLLDQSEEIDMEEYEKRTAKIVSNFR